MWIQRFTKYILQHRLMALLITFASTSTFIPIISALGILIAALVTLTKDIREGAIFTLAAILPYLIVLILTGTTEGSVLPSITTWSLIGLGIPILSNVLTWVFAVMLRKQASWSQILQVAALAGVLTVSVIHLAYPDIMDWWGMKLQEYYAEVPASVLKDAQAVTKAVKSNPQTVDEVTSAANELTNKLANSKAEVAKLTNIYKYYATGVGIALVLFYALMQLAVARWWQAIVFNPGGLKRELHNIRLSHLAGVLFILSLILAYLENSVVLDIMPILYALFVAAGLSLIHYLFGLMSSSVSSWIGLVVFYIVFIISMFTVPAIAILVGLLALVDIWWDVRKRFKKI